MLLFFMLSYGSLESHIRNIVLDELLYGNATQLISDLSYRSYVQAHDISHIITKLVHHIPCSTH